MERSLVEAMRSGWLPSYSVGHPVLDDQHRQLLALCDKAANCLKDSGHQMVENFHLILDALANYARRHFATEEAILAQFDYPLIEQQKAEHLEYQEELADILLAATFGDIERDRLVEYLTDLWTRHILESDMQCRDFLLARQSAGGL